MNKCILLMDEVGIVKIEMNNILKEYGVEVVQVKDSIELINYLHLNGEKVRLILWSFTSRESNDFEVIRKIKSKDNYKDIPIAIVSKFTDRSYIIKAIEAGVSEFIVKPYDNDTVIKKVNKLLGNTLLREGEKERDEFLIYTFDEILNREIKAASRGKHPLTIMLSTITGKEDEGKNVNQYYELIDEIIKILRKKLRDTDTVFHYGANNIIMLLPFCDKASSGPLEQKVKNIFSTSAVIKNKAKEIAVVTSTVTYPDDGREKVKLLDLLMKDMQ